MKIIYLLPYAMHISVLRNAVGDVCFKGLKNGLEFYDEML